MYNGSAQSSLAAFMYILSPSLLNLYQDCARCFWVEIHEKVKRPTDSFATLHSSIQSAFKRYTDQYRLNGSLPKELKGRVDGVFLPDQSLARKWRDVQKGLVYKDEKLDVKLMGHLDECIVRGKEGEQHYVPLKFKTRGFDVQEENHDHHAQLQMDCFDLLLQKNGYNTDGTGYLIYYIPDEIKESGVVQFNVQVIQLIAEPKRAMNLMEEVVKVLDGKMPEAGQNCEYCAWGDLGVRMVRVQT